MSNPTITMEQKINMACSYRRISQAQLAREIGMTPSNFNQKIKRGTFNEEELAKIGEALGAKYVCEFRFEDGTVI